MSWDIGEESVESKCLLGNTPSSMYEEFHYYESFSFLVSTCFEPQEEYHLNSQLQPPKR